MSKNKVLVAPSILSADFANLEADIIKAEKAGANWIHVDVMDGHFVPNITIGAPVVKSIRKVTKMPLDVHLMIENPEKYIEDFAKAGSDLITVHYEACEDIMAVINLIKSFGKKVGVSIKPATNVNVLDKIVGVVDLILIMTVEPGFGGQSFMHSCLDKIAYINAKKKELALDALYIQVDGGITDETAKLVTLNGANVLVAGSYLYNANDISSKIKSLIS